MIKIRSPKVRLTLIGCAVFLIGWMLYWTTSSVTHMVKKQGNILDVQGARIVDDTVLGQEPRALNAMPDEPKPNEDVHGIYNAVNAREKLVQQGARNVDDTVLGQEPRALNAMLEEPKEGVHGISGVREELVQKSQVDQKENPGEKPGGDKISPDKKQEILDSLKLKESLPLEMRLTSNIFAPVSVVPNEHFKQNKTHHPSSTAQPDAFFLHTTTATAVDVKPSKLKPKLSQVYATMHATMRASSNQAIPGNDEFYFLMHGEKASKVNALIHESLSPLPTTIKREDYILTSEKLPDETGLRPSIGNGFLATVIHSKEVFMANLFNGNGPQVHRAVLPSTVSLIIKDVTPKQEVKRSHNLNVGEGIYSEILRAPTFNITQRIYAHRTIRQLLVVEIDLVHSALGGDVELNIELNKWTASYDVTFVKETSASKDVSYKVGHVNAPEAGDSAVPEVHMLYDHVPKVLKPIAGVLRTKWVFLTAIGYTNTEVFKAYNDGMHQIHASDHLYASHVLGWAEVWQKGRIEIHGNTDLARTTYSSWYYIMSSLPMKDDPTVKFTGISPCGLALGDQNKDYQGHVLVDQELWMFPILLDYHPETAKVILNARVNTIDGALYNAQKAGTRGMQFAFESAFSGREVNVDATRGQQALYVSSAVSMAIMKYLDATNDSSIFDPRYENILIGIANFIHSRATLNPDSSLYEFRGVKSPDFLHLVVDNSAFVSSMCKFALSAPKEALRRKHKEMKTFEKIAHSVYVPYNSDVQYHPAFDGYVYQTPLTPVHQADVVLMGYPVQHLMAAQARKNDLIVYQHATDPKAPPTTWAMHSIGWLEVGERKKASDNFLKQLNYTSKDFKVWTEKTSTPSLTASNYISGAGAFLQSLHHGYGGFRLYSNRLDLNPLLPESASLLSYVGIDYLGFTFDVHVSGSDVSVIMTSLSSHDDQLNLFVHQTQQIYTLRKDSPQHFAQSKASLYSSSIDLPNILNK